MTRILRQRICFILITAILFIPLQSVMASVENLSTKHCLMPGCDHTKSSLQNNHDNHDMSQHAQCQDELSCETACQNCGQCHLMVIGSISIISPTHFNEQKRPYLFASKSYIGSIETPPPTTFI